MAWESAAVTTGSAPGSFARLGPAWLHDLAVQQYSPATVQTYGKALGRFAQWCAEREVTQVVQVTRAVVEAYQRHLHSKRSGYGRGPSGTQAAAAATGGLPLSTRTQRSFLTAVARFCTWAVRRGHLPGNPASDLEYPRKVRSLPETLTPDEVAAVLMGCDLTTHEGVRDRAFLEVLYSTGLRKSEALTLTCDEIDAARGIVRVVGGKGGKDRYCPIGAPALAWIARYTHEVRSQWCQDGHEQRLFIDRNPAARMGDLMGSRVHRLLRQAQIRKRGACHLFRHAFATHLLENGCDIRLIGSMLGHDDLSSTAIYTHVGVRKLVQAHAAFHPAAKNGGEEKSGGASCVPEVPTKDATP